jgi:signal transduction histidine kinase
MKRLAKAVPVVLAYACLLLFSPGNSASAEASNGSKNGTLSSTESPWFERLMEKFSQDLQTIQSERAMLLQWLNALPPAPKPQRMERLGHHSDYSTSSDSVEWVELDLGTEEPIDAVVLIAAAGNSGGSVPVGYGFPVRFQVEFAGDPLNRQEHRHRVAEFTREDFPNPKALPVYLSTQNRRARFVRITATKLYRSEGRYLFALGEIMLLQKGRNIANRVGLTKIASNRSMGTIPLWGRQNLVDGYTAIGAPVGKQISPTLGYKSAGIRFPDRPKSIPSVETPNPEKWVQVDLGDAYDVSDVSLFPARAPEFAHRPGYGFPLRYRVELSMDPDFESPTVIGPFFRGPLEPSRDEPNPGDCPLSFDAGGKTARYVRVTATELHNSNGAYLFALAELEVWANGQNVAYKKPVSALDSTEAKGWSMASLVDGYNSESEILEWQGWLSGLSRRREALYDMALLDTRKAQLLGLYQSRASKAGGGFLISAFIVLSVVLIRQRQQKRQELAALRLRISQDLHDEIGSSLCSIALISREVMNNRGNAVLVADDANEIQKIVRSTADSMHDIIQLVNSNAYERGDLRQHLQEIANRLLRSIPHTLDYEANAIPTGTPVDKKHDLVLMFKETLHNVAKHSQASQAQIKFTRNNGSIVLTVKDDGLGFEPATAQSSGMGLTNLHRRARKHGGQVDILSTLGKGTQISIIIPAYDK